MLTVISIIGSQTQTSRVKNQNPGRYKDVLSFLQTRSMIDSSPSASEARTYLCIYLFIFNTFIGV